VNQEKTDQRYSECAGSGSLRSKPTKNNKEKLRSNWRRGKGGEPGTRREKKQLWVKRNPQECWERTRGLCIENDPCETHFVRGVFRHLGGEFEQNPSGQREIVVTILKTKTLKNGRDDQQKRVEKKREKTRVTFWLMRNAEGEATKKQGRK